MYARDIKRELQNTTIIFLVTFKYIALAYSNPFFSSKSRHVLWSFYDTHSSVLYPLSGLNSLNSALRLVSHVCWLEAVGCLCFRLSIEALPTLHKCMPPYLGLPELRLQMSSRFYPTCGRASIPSFAARMTQFAEFNAFSKFGIPLKLFV